jgi:hypothetical protein
MAEYLGQWTTQSILGPSPNYLLRSGIGTTAVLWYENLLNKYWSIVAKATSESIYVL